MSIAEHTTELRPGQRLTRTEFLRRWESRPDVKFAELIDGVVYMPSPQTTDHGTREFDINGLLWTYVAHTPGCEGGNQSTWLMLQSAPQPDAYLWISPQCGGQSGIRGQYHTGAPELISETCFSSADYDLGVKKRLYETAGVQEYVAVIIEDKEVRWHRLVKGAYQLRQPTSKGVFRSEVFPGLWVDERALWKRDAAGLLATLERGLKSPEHRAFVKALAARKAQPKRQ